MYATISGNYILTLTAENFLTNTKKIYLECDTSSASVNITLPKIATFGGTWGFEVYVNDKSANASVNNITVTCNSADKINGSASPIILNTNGGNGVFEIIDTVTWQFNTLFSATSQQLSGVKLLGKIIGLNMNSTADQVLTLAGGTKFIVIDVRLANPSTNLNTVQQGQWWTGTNKSGTMLYNTFAFGETLPILNAVNKQIGLLSGEIALLGAQNLILGNTMYYSNAVAQGAVATCDCYVYGYILS